MNTKILMVLSVVVLWFLGLVFSFIPSELMKYLNIDLNGINILLLQILGALYLGFAILNWMLRKTTIGWIYNRPLMIANLMHFAMSAIAILKSASSIEWYAGIIIWLTIIYSLFAISFAYICFFSTSTSK